MQVELSIYIVQVFWKFILLQVVFLGVQDALRLHNVAKYINLDPNEEEHKISQQIINKVEQNNSGMEKHFQKTLALISAPQVSRWQILKSEYAGVDLSSYWITNTKRHKQQQDSPQDTISDIVEIVKQLMQALGALHQAGFGHGDIKGENICVAFEESETTHADSQAIFTVKIINFGLSRQLQLGGPVTIDLDIRNAGVVLAQLLLATWSDPGARKADDKQRQTHKILEKELSEISFGTIDADPDFTFLKSLAMYMMSPGDNNKFGFQDETRLATTRGPTADDVLYLLSIKGNPPIEQEQSLVSDFQFQYKQPPKSILDENTHTWQESQKMCSLCPTQLKGFFTQHHCRLCGSVVCGSCSEDKAVLNGTHIGICSKSKIGLWSKPEKLFTQSRNLMAKGNPKANWISACLTIQREGTPNTCLRVCTKCKQDLKKAVEAKKSKPNVP